MPAMRERATWKQSPVVDSQTTLRDTGSSSRYGFLERIRIDHGPIDVLGRFFLLADSMARSLGVTLAFASMQELVAVNRANADSWRPLLPHYDPSFGGIDNQNAFCVVGLNRGGEVVATQAARLYTLTEASLHDEATSLRLFYPDPSAQGLDGESCVISATAARTIAGRVAFSGAAWYRPDYRARDLAPVMSRISRAYSHAIWNTDYAVTFVAKALVEKGFVQRCGYANLQWGVELHGFAIGHYHGALAWIDTGQMVEDLLMYMASREPEVDVGIRERRA
jgi:hypothetical protein